MKLKPLLKGISTYIPGMHIFRRKITGGTGSAKYCYSVWLRHLVMANHKNRLTPFPAVVAELGPGDSIGTGLAALISGAEQYYSFDVVDYSNNERNLEIFDELVELFKNKADIPHQLEFAEIKPYLDDYSFPTMVLTDEWLKAVLSDERIAKIRNSITKINDHDAMINYMVPWFDSGVLKTESVDMIYSQAVLEHVDDLPHTYNTMYQWLKPSGFMSHQIDFKCHTTAQQWNGHWAYSDFQWKLIKGKQVYLLNREPYSTHKNILRETGFKVICSKTVDLASNLSRNKLAPRFKCLSDDDLKTSGAFIQAIKK